MHHDGSTQRHATYLIGHATGDAHGTAPDLHSRFTAAECLADLIGILHDDDVPDIDHALLLHCAPEDLRCVDEHAARLNGFCQLRARQLMEIASRLPEAGAPPTDVRVLLQHAGSALDEAEQWTHLATSARCVRAHVQSNA